MARAAGIMLLLVLAGAGRAEPPPAAAQAELAAAPWSAGAARPFVAWRAELGSTAHLQGTVGFGQPWWLWGGLDVDVWASPDYAVAAARLKANLLLANLGVGWRWNHYWKRVAMPPRRSHDAFAEGGGSTFQALDVGLDGAVPTPGGYALWNVQAARLLGVRSDVHVLDEAVHAIVKPPWSGAVGVGWVADLRSGDLQVGISAEAIVDARPGPLLVRVGPQASWSISRHWEARLRLVTQVTSPDRLGFRDDLNGAVLIGWRDATGRGPAPR